MAGMVTRQSTLDAIKEMDFRSFQLSDVQLISAKALPGFVLFLIKELDKKRSPPPSQENKLVTNQLESILSQMKELRQDNQDLQTLIKANGTVSNTNIETCIGEGLDKHFQARDLISGGAMQPGTEKSPDEIMNRIDRQFEKHNIPLIFDAVNNIENAVKDMDLNISNVASNVDTNIKKSMNNNNAAIKKVEASFSNKLLSSSNANKKITQAPGAQYTMSNGKGKGIQYDAKKTVIISGFTNTALKDSQSLKRAISQHFPFIGIDLAFTSIKGTITFQFKTEAEADKVINEWKENYFVNKANNKSKAAKPIEGKVHGVIIDAPLIFTDEEFETVIKKTYQIEDKSCRRMIIKGKRSPLMTVKFTSHAELTKAITEGLKIKETTTDGELQLKLNVEESRRRKAQIIRCYNCQKFGSHIARLCTGTRACISCGKDHEDCKTTETLKCANCEGSHKADSADCPKFKAYKEKIENSASK